MCSLLLIIIKETWSLLKQCVPAATLTLGQHDLLQQKSDGVLLVQDYQLLQWIPAQAHAGYLLPAGIPKENK